ncbi:MAG: hypothetical protein EXR79_04555 [Myxococcales bacterium]|nr:hypothetical protein [Myxococcales bacterium]
MSAVGARRAGAVVVAVTLTLAAAGAAWWAWGGASGRRPVVLADWVPIDAAPVVWIDELGATIDGAAALAQAVAGTAGLLDAAEIAAGLDLRDAAAVGRAGLRLDAGVVGFGWQQGEWLVVPVEGRAGVEHLVGVVRRRGHAVVELPSAPSPAQLAYTVADRADATREVGWLWWVPPVLIGRIGASAAGAAGASTFAAWHSAPRRTAASLTGAPGQLHARLPLDSAQRAAAHHGLGPLNFLLGAALDRLHGLEADAHVGRDGVTVTARLTAAPGQLQDVAAYHQGFVADAPGETLDLGDLLPDETVALARARLNPALLQWLPAAVRDAVWPASALERLHPALVGVDARQLLDELDGQVAFALLGIADAVPLDPRQWAALAPRLALRGAVAVAFRQPEAAARFVDRCRSALDTHPERPTTVAFGAWNGLAVPGPTVPWWLLRRGRDVVLVSGVDAHEDLDRVARGKFPSLAAAAGSELARSVVQGTGAWLAGRVETPRIARSLRRRGMPDYVVQMVASLGEGTVAVALGPDAVTIHAEIRPGTTAAQPQAAPPGTTAGAP